MQTLFMPAATAAAARPSRQPRRWALYAGAAAMMALPLAVAPRAHAQAFGQSAAPGAPGSPNYYGRPTTHGPEPEEKPKHEEAPPGEEPAVRIPAPKIQVAPPDADAIAAVVNGDVITRDDVENRARLFGLSTGLNITPELLARLKPQLVRELIDDRLKLQEIQHRKIVVSDADVAAAIGNVEQRNGLQHGGLREKLAKQGVSFGTLIEQTRTSLGWTRVLRQELAQRGFVTPGRGG